MPGAAAFGGLGWFDRHPRIVRCAVAQLRHARPRSVPAQRPRLVAACVRPARPAPPARAHRRPDRGQQPARRRRRRPPRPRRLDRPHGGRSPASRSQPRDEPAHPAAGRGRPPAARRPPPRCRVPGNRGRPARAVRPQGLAGRALRQPLPDLRPGSDPRGGRLGSDRRRARPADLEAVPLHRLPRPAGRRRAAPRTGRRGRHQADQRDARRSARPAGRSASDSRIPRARRRWSIDPRPAHPASAARPPGDPRANRDRPARPGRRGGDAPGPPPRDPAGLAPERLPGPDRDASDQPRPGQAAGRRPVARAQSVARLRGCLPARPRLRPAPRGRPDGADAGALRRRLPGPRRRHRQRRPAARHAVGLPGPGGRSRVARASSPTGPGSGSCSASRRCGRTRSGCRSPTSATAWVLGREAASLVPIEAAPRHDRASSAGAGSRPRSGGPTKPPHRSWPATPGRSWSSRRVVRRGSWRRSWAASGPATAWWPPALPSRARRPAGSSSSCRRERRSRSGRGPAPTSRLPALPGGPGDPDLVPGRGLFAPPERVRPRTASPSRTSPGPSPTTAVAILQARGEPARTERLLGEILVGLDRAGHLRRLVRPGGRGSADRAAAEGDAVRRRAAVRPRRATPAADRRPDLRSGIRREPASADPRARPGRGPAQLGRATSLRRPRPPPAAAAGVDRPPNRVRRPRGGRRRRPGRAPARP